VQDNRFPFPDRKSSLDILLRDPCFDKIPKDRIQDIFDDAWLAGATEAKSFIDEYCYAFCFDMFGILKELGFKIIPQDIDYVMGNMRYFCEYLSGKNTFYIYNKSVALWAETHHMEFAMARNIILAHEFFHYLEANKIGWVSKRCTVPMLKIGKVSIGKTGISALSEIAANSFANAYYTEYVASLGSKG
jgi:hypothetical protein